MRNLDKKLREIRPSLRLIAPHTFYVSWGFAIFNVLAGLSLWGYPQDKFLVVGVLSLKVWAFLFIALGLSFMYALHMNEWRMTRGLMVIGILIKTSWLMELTARAIIGRSFLLVFVWALVIYLQLITYLYFTPVEVRGGR